MLKKGFLFGLGLIGALVVAVIVITMIGGLQTKQSEFMKPTLQGLRSVVIGRKYDCIDTASNSMEELSTGRWQLNCPGETYIITLTRDGDVVSVRRMTRD